MQTITQSVGVPNGIPPASLNSSRASTDGVDMQKCRSAFFELYIGAITAGSISAWLQESADNITFTTNATAGAFSGSSGTSVSRTGMVTSSAMETFEVRADQMTSGQRYCRLQVKETAGSAVIVCVVAKACYLDQMPGTAMNGTHYATNGHQNVVA